MLEKCESFFDNGNIMSLYYMNKDGIQGMLTRYFYSGFMFCYTSYKNNMLCGVCFSFSNVKNKIDFITSYKLDSIHGIDVEFNYYEESRN